MFSNNQLRSIATAALAALLVEETTSCKRHSSDDLSQASMPASERAYVQKVINSPRQFAFAGTPVTQESVTYLKNTYYAVGYDESRHDPAFVVCYFTNFHKSSHPDKRPQKFATDNGYGIQFQLQITKTLATTGAT